MTILILLSYDVYAESISVYHSLAKYLLSKRGTLIFIIQTPKNYQELATKDNLWYNKFALLDNMPMNFFFK